MEELMFEAIHEQSMQKLENILAQGANINAINKNGVTAIQMAVECHNPEMTQLLIDSGANVNAQMRAQFNARLMEIICGSSLRFEDFLKEIIPEIKSLIIGGADVNLKGNHSRDSTILHYAAIYTDADLVKFLLDRGAIIDAKNEDGETPLHKAAENPFFVSKLEVLLEAGADPNAKDYIRNRRGTPLHILIDSCYVKSHIKVDIIVEAIKLFKKYNADFNAQDAFGRTAAFYTHSAPFEIFQAFFKIEGTDVNGIVVHKNTDLVKSKDLRVCPGQTMLHVLCYKETSQYENFEYLCKMGADINVLDARNRSPLQYAITNWNIHRDLRKLRYLLENNSRVDTNGGYNILNIKMTNFFLPYNSPIPGFIWKLLVEHIAKLNAAGHLVDEMTMKTLEGNPTYLKYFDDCTKELNQLKKTKLLCTGVLFFDLLVDDKKKLIRYARNEAAVKEFEKTENIQKKFPIFSDSIDKRFNKAIIFVKSRVILSSCLPCNFNPSHLVIDKILSSFTAHDIRILCEIEKPQSPAPPTAVRNRQDFFFAR